MQFNWTSRTLGDWRELLKQAPRANWMQSWPYAKAVRQLDYRTTRLATIDHHGGPIGVMAMQEIQLGPIHFIQLNRGPLWLSDNTSETHLREFALLFRDSFPRRMLRRLRWLPEWENSESHQQLLVESGFRTTPSTFQTIWLDLQCSEEVRRKRLKSNWRNHLKNAEKSNLTIHSDWEGENLGVFLNLYDMHKMKKKFHGSTSAFVREEIVAALPFKEVLLMWALMNKQPIAGVMILLHGQCATYRVGWNTSLGRKHNAHYILLWEAQKILQDRQIRSFDLGGIRYGENDGYTYFKAGMGGREIEHLKIHR